MNRPQSEEERPQSPTQEGLKVLGWIILLLGILTLAIGLPLTALGI